MTINSTVEWRKLLAEKSPPTLTVMWPNGLVMALTTVVPPLVLLKLLEYLRELSRTSNVAISTHSPPFLCGTQASGETFANGSTLIRRWGVVGGSSADRVRIALFGRQ